jgi:CheY-like chemotaxis protein
MTADPCNSRHLMVVDDDPAIRSLFTSILGADLPGYDVDAAANGADALDLFKKQHHAVIVMDLHMPVLNGLDAYERIEQFCGESSWEVPGIVFCTGFTPPSNIARVLGDDRRTCLIRKPVTAGDLLKNIRSFL